VVHPPAPVAEPRVSSRALFPGSLAAGLAVSLKLAGLDVRRFGGITGDVLGAAAEIAMAACLVVSALR
jgi:adenosylcobinamide-GDP ribazoletransferase